MKFTKVAAVAAALGIVMAGAAIAAPANAEPVSNSYTLVGSDTLQDVVNALTNGTDVTGARVRVTANNQTVGSFDSFGSSAIQAKPGGEFFGRPSGSGQGLNALSASISGTTYTGNAAIPKKNITGQVDIARSSSGWGNNEDPTNGKLAYVPFGRDALGFAYKGGTSAWAHLTFDQIKGVYAGTITSIDGVPIKPILPQISSGTRKFFLKALTGSETGAAPGVSAGTERGQYSNTSTAENDGTVLQAGEIIPFSVANWVAQSNGATGVNTTANVSFGGAQGSTDPFTVADGKLVPNAAYYSDATFGRDTYLIVERARITANDPKYDAALAALVKPGTSAVAQSLAGFNTQGANQPGRVKQVFGFLAPSSFVVHYAYATLPY
ncbi:substrate-binding domain-containing protein [uncultured Microbacterium sp.]|uniref:substrate-binding domain-containing protein n=1 Tax=uncultured Microbacterium sp. TaxID=191216 RepID=UPI0025CEDF0E|nr:substrate-binding domain-containing protein [uncultured Microbacterium sp.]